MNLFALLEGAAKRYPDQGAVYAGTRQAFTFQELREKALGLAAGLSSRGVRGDRVLVASKNDPEVLVAMFGIWAAGMVFTPLNAKLHPREMADIVSDARPLCIFAADELAAPLAEQLDAPERICVFGTSVYQSIIAHPPIEPVAVSPDMLAWLFYTSGTTGRSKGAMLSHRNLTAMTLAHLADFEDLSNGDSILHAAPLSHGSGLYVLPYIARGARQVIPASGGFDPGEFLDLCDAHPGCGAFLAPTMVQRLRIRAEESGRRPANLRSVLYGGGPMYLDEIRRSLAWFGPVFRQLYGQGEAPMTITGLRQTDFLAGTDDVLASVGWSRTGVEVAVVDEAGHMLPAGEIGEIVCRGDVVMTGYWNQPDATATTLRDGWLYTGDLGCMDPTGMLTLRDRSKDVIISGGSNIYPREVEEVLLAHPNVREAAVLGRADRQWGEVVIAVIVPEPGSALESQDLDRLCLNRIARFKRPKHYVFVEELPKNSYGKVLKRELLAKLQALDA